MPRLASLLLALLVAAGCRDDRSKPIIHDAGRARRVFEKPAGEVRAVPPHAIRADGVGPYLLGTPLDDVLDLRAHGPQVVVFEIEDAFDVSLIKAENGTLLIGAERASGVSYVAVLERAIARTEDGVGVGSTRAEVEAALGKPLAGAQRLRDPRLEVFTKLPNTRFVIDGDKVSAVVVGLDGRPRPRRPPAEPVPAAPAPPGPAPEPPPAPRCEALEATPEAAGAAARLEGTDVRVLTACLAPTEPMLIVSGDERVAAVGGESTKLRRIDQQLAPGLLFAGPIDIDRDGRDEVAVVARRTDGDGRSWVVDIYRLEQGKLVPRMPRKVLYTIGQRSAELVGARLDDIDLLVELWIDGEFVRSRGLFVHRGSQAPRNVVPLRPHGFRVPPVDTGPVDPGARRSPGAPASEPEPREP